MSILIKYHFFILAILCVVKLCKSLAVPSNPIVALDYAALRGTVSVGGSVAKFLNVPYAAPPVGNQRFRPPLPPIVVPNNTILDATQAGNMCMQYQAPGTFPQASEDCLNLNVFTPSLDPTSNLPVFVYVHGGGFNFGYNDPSFFDGSNFLSVTNRKAVVVVINYRLNVFGFLASRELAAQNSLNAGLLDQVAAFQWIRKYIQQFGGNPANVIGWGESAGGKSVITHMFALNGTSNLFDKAISQSAALLPYYNTPATFQPNFDKLVNAISCQPGGTRNPSGNIDVISCLQIVDASTLYSVADSLRFTYAPVVDGTYLVSQPNIMLSQNQMRAVPLILFRNTNEGTIFTANADLSTNSKIQSFLSTSFPYLDSDAINRILSLYPPATTSPFYATSEAYGDGNYNCPERMLSLAFASVGAPVYKARFNRIPSIPPGSPSFYSRLGVFHSAELPFTWNYGPRLGSTNGETTLAAQMIQSYVDFAYGDMPGTTIGVQWPLFNVAQMQTVWQVPYTGQLETGGKSFYDKCDFWFSQSLKASYRT